jgi:hypothetical protein
MPVMNAQRFPLLAKKLNRAKIPDHADRQPDEFQEKGGIGELAGGFDKDAIHDQRACQPDDKIGTASELEHQGVDHRKPGDPVEVVRAAFHPACQFGNCRLQALRRQGAFVHNGRLLRGRVE